MNDMEACHEQIVIMTHFIFQTVSHFRKEQDTGIERMKGRSKKYEMGVKTILFTAQEQQAKEWRSIFSIFFPLNFFRIKEVKIPEKV